MAQLGDYDSACHFFSAESKRPPANPSAVDAAKPAGCLFVCLFQVRSPAAAGHHLVSSLYRFSAQLIISCMFSFLFGFALVPSWSNNCLLNLRLGTPDLSFRTHGDAFLLGPNPIDCNGHSPQVLSAGPGLFCPIPNTTVFGS
jgi:hypothetical protein